jgi:hypothetical protein
MHISAYLITFHDYFPFSRDNMIPGVKTALLNHLCGSVVVKTLCYRPEGLRFET